MVAMPYDAGALRFDGTRGARPLSDQFEFTQDWFGPYEPIWTEVLRRLLPRSSKILEIGSYEGRSATWLIRNALSDDGVLYCIDTWSGGIEHDPSIMGAVEARFDRNIAIARAHKPGVKVRKIKGTSDLALARLLGEHANSFDFIYVDGSHQAADVLTDLILAFGLCRVGGLIVCDDYLWQFGQNPLLVPKTAIDAFVNCFMLKVAPLNGVPLDQLWLRKRAL